MAEDLTIDTIKMVREIRDRMHDEMQGMTRAQRLEYIRRKGAEAEKQMGITATQPHGQD